jgi:hypothetical protein
MPAAFAIAQQPSPLTTTYHFWHDGLAPSWVLVGGGTPPPVVVGGCEVVGVEAVGVGRVSLDEVAELATCRAREVSKVNMQS